MVVVLAHHYCRADEDMGDMVQEGNRGLLRMRERAHIVGGTMTLESSAGRDMTICIRGPFAAQKPVRS